MYRYTHMENYTMIQYLKSIIKWFTRPDNYEAEFESYILSKKPASVAEVDYWTRQYEFNKFRNKGWL